MTKTFCGLMAASLLFSVVKPTRDARATELPESMTLQDCLDLALKQNPSILKAQQEIRRTQGVIGLSFGPAQGQAGFATDIVVDSLSMVNVHDGVLLGDRKSVV